MKKKLFLSAIFALTLLQAQTPANLDKMQGKSTENILKIPALSPRAWVKQDFSVSMIKINYGRPSMNGRKIFGELVPFDQLWRAGANQATMLSFGQDVKVNGQMLAAGEYALYVIPRENADWSVIFSKNEKLHHGDAKNFDDKEAVLKLEVPAQKMENMQVETFTIDVWQVNEDTATIWLGWENHSISLKITEADEDIVIKTIDQLMTLEGEKPYYQAADYYFRHGKDAHKALAWLQQIPADNQYFWIDILHTKLLLAVGKPSDAQKTLNSAKLKAEKMNLTQMAEKPIEELQAKITAESGKKHVKKGKK